MNHLTEDQLTAAYYDELDSTPRVHLNECAECGAEFERLKVLLDGLRDHPVPERGPAWENELWRRLSLEPRVPIVKRLMPRLRWWMAIPAFAAVAVIAFVAGMLTQHQRARQSAPQQTGERVLLIAIGDHLDRSQIVLAELVHGSAASVDLAGERARARDLLADNRLLRQTAARAGETSSAAVLDDLERILMEIANSPSDMNESDLEAIQQRIENAGLLFKVRIISTNVKRKGMKL
jgi:hypothetical protein